MLTLWISLRESFFSWQMRLHNDDRMGRSRSSFVHHRMAAVSGGEQLNGRCLLESSFGLYPVLTNLLFMCIYIYTAVNRVLFKVPGGSGLIIPVSPLR